MYEKWTTEEDQKLRDNYQLTQEQIQELFPNRNYNGLNQRASILGLRKHHNQYCESDTSSLLQETTEAYYWVGFILADGHISNLNRLTIALANKDYEHLEKFGNFVSCKNILQRKNNACCISIKDNLHVKELKEKFDIRNDKTYYPPDLSWISNRDLFLSLFAGYTDGDGCIKNNHTKKDIHIAYHVHSAWLSFLELLENRLTGYFSIPTGKPGIGKDGYARFNISNFSLIKEIKKSIEGFNLPLLERKWSKIDTNLLNRYELAELTKQKVLKLLYDGNTITEINDKLDIYNSSVIIKKSGINYKEFKKNRVKI